MAIVRCDPFRDFFGLNRDLVRYFRRWEEDDDTVSALWRPAVDIFETEDNLVLRAELPGLSRDEVSIDVEKNVLTLRGERKFSNEIKRENYHRVERAYGSFSRSFTLPANMEPGKIAARFENGVLEVTVPKSEEAKPRQIEIEVK